MMGLSDVSKKKLHCRK
uniref:Uncharacterized protein n=1 Tax=Anguilla anguilla TaxID=7936 RepID=A0A0E9PVU4_ANGAN